LYPWILALQEAVLEVGEKEKIFSSFRGKARIRWEIWENFLLSLAREHLRSISPSILEMD
jgi:hypothetical protein